MGDQELFTSKNSQPASRPRPDVYRVQRLQTVRPSSAGPSALPLSAFSTCASAAACYLCIFSYYCRPTEEDLVVPMRDLAVHVTQRPTIANR